MKSFKSYLVEEIFEDIPGDPDNVIFNIPQEICEEAGIVPGDTISITLDNGKIIFRKV
jgi:hypothetical protein